MKESMMFSPDLLPETADPEGSTRYYVTIMIKCIPYSVNDIKMIDLINTNSLFIIEKYGDFSEIKTDIFDGVVLKEKDGQIGWWPRIKQEKKYPIIKYDI